MTNSNRPLVEAFYRASAKRDVEQVMGFIDDKVEWILQGPIDVFPFFGQRRGKAAVLEAIARSHRKLEVTGYEVEALLVDGDRAAALIRLSSIVRDDRQDDERADHAILALARRQDRRHARGVRHLRPRRADAGRAARPVRQNVGRVGFRLNQALRRAFSAVCAPRPSATARSDPSPIVETDIPARLDRLPWGRFHTLVVVALGITWILDGLEVTLAGTVAGALKASPVLQFTNADVGLAGSAYLAGAVLGALFFGWLTDRLGPQEAVLHHADGLSRSRPPRPRSRGIFWSFAALPLPHRRGHRRRIRGDQLDHPGTDPGARARLDRPRHQRQLLDRRGARRARRRSCCSIPAVIDPEHRLARRLPDRRGCSALRRVLHAAVAAGKPALADDAWPRRAKPRRIVAGIEARLRAEGHVDPGRAAAEGAAARAHATRRSARSSHTLFHVHRQRTLVGARADGGAGVLLQRDLLHLCAGADRLLRHPVRARRLVHPAVRGRQFPRARSCSAGCSTRSAAGR